MEREEYKEGPGFVRFSDDQPDPAPSCGSSTTDMEIIRDLEETRSDSSFTRQKVRMLAAPDEMPRPRGLFRAEDTSKKSRKMMLSTDHQHYPEFATRAHRNIIHRSTGSRLRYLFLLLNMIVWIPLWLKLLTIQREIFNDHHVAIWNSSVSMTLHVSTFDDPGGEYCNMCDENEVFDGITYPIIAEIENFASYPHIPTPNFIVILGSYDFENWFVVNEPGTFTGLADGDSMNDVCLKKGITLEDDDLVPDTDDYFDTSSEVNQAETSFKDFHKETTTATDYTPEGAVQEQLDYMETITVWATKSPTAWQDNKETPAPTSVKKKDERVSRCCLGNPGFIYLVACATPYEYLKTAGFYGRVGGPPFDGQCITIAGRCGVACGVDADVPIPGTCDENGIIPMKELIDEDILNGESGSPKKKRIRHYDRGEKMKSMRAKAYHVSFVVFVTLMAIGTWISFLAGTGKVDPVPKPSMSEVEGFMASDSSEKKPLVLVAFSISASEPRMMVLRNFCGKLNSWIHQRKFSLHPRSAADAIFRDDGTPRKGDSPTNNRDAFSDTEEDEDDDMDFFSVTSDGENSNAQMQKNLTEYSEFIDIFQDEGHRVGAYALWDAFVNLVHDTDLRFVECMAKKMTKMTAEDDRLAGKTFDDGQLLDDELRELASKPDVGVSQKNVDRLELAYACFDLLSALGHHAFWKTDGRINSVGFRDLATNPQACTTLRIWAANFKKDRKLGNPFAEHIAPTESDGIGTNVWNVWWELYNEMGRNQWLKRFDCIKFRQVRLHYYRNSKEVGQEHQHRDLMMCYSARANPEDLKIQLAPTRNKRGIAVGVFVRLKEADSRETSACFAKYGLRRLGRSEARRCHARVVSFCQIDGHSFVKVKECTPELLRVLPLRFLASQGEVAENDEDLEYFDEDDEERFQEVFLNSSNDGEFAGEEAILPVECIAPLRESRGKSGGMNAAMEIINYYIRHHSSTFRLMSQQRLGAAPSATRQADAADAHLLFAIFDCRHMATQGFWDTVIPYFFGYRHVNNPWSRELMIDQDVAFVQLPQTFTSLSIEDDIFDMRNEYLFRLANNVRSGVGAITSCGTNAVWNYDVRYQETPLEHRFNEDTMIEDTASSHDVIIDGRKGVYHFERLVLGARKGTNDYLAAVFRWSRGAVQLFWTTFWFPRYKYQWPWVVLVIHVVPIAGISFYFHTVELNECHQTPLTARSGLVPCRMGPVVGLICDPFFVLYLIWMCTLAAVSYNWHRVGAFTVMFENVTYFFTSVSAFYWSSMPIYMCVAESGVPPIFDTQLIVLGALWLQLHMGMILNQIKQWSPLENGVAPSNLSLLRSQQMYFCTAPLHFLAICFGMADGYNIVFHRKDASRWNSFDSILAMTAVKLWMIFMIFILIVSIGVAIFRMCTVDETVEQQGARMLGIFFCVIIIYLIETPVRAMFFYDRVAKEKSKPSRIDKITASIFGSKQAIRTDYIYLALWALLLFWSLRPSELDASEGILNTKSRCDISSKYAGCSPDELYRRVRLEDGVLVEMASSEEDGGSQNTLSLVAAAAARL